MNTELKKRKTVVSRKRSRPTESVRPEEVKLLSPLCFVEITACCFLCMYNLR